MSSTPDEGSPAAGLARWVSLSFGRLQPSDAAERRYVGIVRGAVSALASRGVSIVVSLVAVPLTVGYLGAERYGAWIAITGFLTWFQLADLGLANGITNNVAAANANAQPELAQRYVSTAFWILILVAFVLGIAFSIAYVTVDWAALFNVHSKLATHEVPVAIGLAFALFVIGLPLTIIDKLYAAHQEGAISNLWAMAANVLTLASLLAVTHSRGGMPVLVIAVAGTRLLVLLASAIWLFARHRPNLAPRPSRFDRAAARRLGADGSQFFLIQIASLLLFSTDNFIIARVLGPSDVTPYSVTWTLFSFAQILASIASPYVWPAYVEAATRGDVDWIARTFRLNVVIAVGFALLVGIPLMLFGGHIIQLWAGREAVPPQALLIWMAAWSAVFAFSTSVSSVLNATKRLRGQMIYGVTTALANIALSLWWAREFGITGVIAATVVAYLLLAVVPMSLETMWTFRTLRRSV